MNINITVEEHSLPVKGVYQELGFFLSPRQPSLSLEAVVTQGPGKATHKQWAASALCSQSWDNLVK